MPLHEGVKSSGVLAAGSADLTTAPGLVWGYMLSAGTAATSLVIKDGGSGGTTLVSDSMKSQTAAGDLTISVQFTVPVIFSTSIYYTVAGTAGTAIIYYTPF